MALKRAVGLDVFRCSLGECFLSSETVEGASLALEGVDDVHGGDGLALGVLAVGDGVSDDVLEEHLQHSAGLLVDEAGDALHASTTGQTTDGRLGDALDVVAKHLAMALGSSFAESFASLSRPDIAAITLTNEMPAYRSGRLYVLRRVPPLRPTPPPAGVSR